MRDIHIASNFKNLASDATRISCNFHRSESERSLRPLHWTSHLFRLKPSYPTHPRDSIPMWRLQRMARPPHHLSFPQLSKFVVVNSAESILLSWRSQKHAGSWLRPPPRRLGVEAACKRLKSEAGDLLLDGVRRRLSLAMIASWCSLVNFLMILWSDDLM